MDKDKFAKALAYFLERELIEDVHAEYNITNNEVKEINKTAVNRARMIIDFLDDEKAIEAFYNVYSIYVYEWDDPEKTEDTEFNRFMIEKAKGLLDEGFSGYWQANQNKQ